MKIDSLKLPALAMALSILAQSCVGPTYVQSTPPPPPPVYAQEPPPAPIYTEQPAPEQAPPPPVSYQSFYNELSPYGQWISRPEYGYVWVPAAGPDFQPYASCGHWVMTTYGWTWASDYSWGWAAFHYGSWDFDGTLGWYWIPGNQWSPAWVSWRSTPGYYGWAPLGPTYVNGGYATYNCPQQNYVFVSATYINSPNVATYYIPRTQNTGYYSSSAVITNTYYDRGSNVTYYAGPQSTEVERYTGTPVRPVTIVQASSPERAGISGNQISMFRPAVQQPNSNATVGPVPPTVYQKSEITPVTQRTVLTRPNQPRLAPFKPENTQPLTQPIRPQEQNRQQPPPVQDQQRPATQQQIPVIQEQHAPVQPPAQEHQAPPVQHAPVQQQQRPAPQPQQPIRQQQPRQSKPQKQKAQPKPQPKQAQEQGKAQQ